MKHSPFFLALSRSLWVAIIAALSGCGPLVHREVPGKVLALEGAATATRRGQSRALTNTSFIYPGETIAASAGSRLDLMLVPGVLVELSGGTEMEFVQLHLEQDGNDDIHPMTARDATVRLLRGSLIASTALPQTEPELTVITSAGTLTAGSAETFEIALASNRAQVFSVRGDANFRANSASITTIGQGYLAEFPSNGQAPQPAAAAGAKAQAKVPELLAVEERLLRLSQENGFPSKPR